MRFEKKEDCFLDTETGLEWELKQCEEQFNHKEAIEYCENLGSYWRLPTRPELESVLNSEKFNPKTELPGMKASNYWSCTADVNNPDIAWYVNFYYGNVYYGSYKSSLLFVRAVRGKGK